MLLAIGYDIFVVCQMQSRFEDNAETCAMAAIRSSSWSVKITMAQIYFPTLLTISTLPLHNFPLSSRPGSRKLRWTSYWTRSFRWCEEAGLGRDSFYTCSPSEQLHCMGLPPSRYPWCAKNGSVMFPPSFASIKCTWSLSRRSSKRGSRGVLHTSWFLRPLNHALYKVRRFVKVFFLFIVF